MGRLSEPMSTRVGKTTYWVFTNYGIELPSIFLQDYWILNGLKKLCNWTRERITIFTDIIWAKHFIFVYILLLIIKHTFIRKRQRILKKRVLFLLFKRFVYRKIWKTKKIFHSYYNKRLSFLNNMKNRFLSYCDLICKKFNQDVILKSLKNNSFLKKNKNKYVKLPLKLTIKNFFSAMDRSYLYIWKYFHDFICNQMWYAKKMRYFISTLKIFFVFLFVPSARLLADHIAYILKKSRKHWQIIKTLQQILEILPTFSPNFKYLKIKIKGCIQDAERTRTALLGRNFLILQTFTTPLQYAMAHSATPFGSLGIKIWITE